MPRMETLVIAVAVTVMIVTAWIILYTLISGLGVVVYRLAGRRREQLEDVPLTFWVGWAVLIAYLQVWHLFFRVSPNTAIPVILIGAIGAWSGRRDFWAWIKRLLKHPLVLVGLGVIALLTVFFSWRGVYSYDDGLYHLQDVKWITSYSIVPGLGNLHGRFAFNTTHTLYIAFLEKFPLVPPARHIAHGLMLMAFSLQMVTALIAILRREAQTLDNYFYVLLFPSAMMIAMGQDNYGAYYLGSIKNDFAVVILGSLLSAQIAKYGQRLFSPACTERLGWATLIALSLIVFASMTVKLNLAVFSAGLFLVILASSFKRMVAVGLALFVTITGVWMSRGVILSGYLLYPLDILPVSVDWKMSARWVNIESDGVMGWARMPGPNYSDSLGNYDWLKGWIDDNIQHSYHLVIPLGIAFSLIVLHVVLVALRKRKPLPDEGVWILPAVALVAMFYWFFTAPALRFGWSIFWILAISMGIMTLKQAKLLANRALILVLFFLLTMPVLISVGLHFKHSQHSADFTRGMVFPPPPITTVDAVVTQSGLEVVTPTVSDQCWAVPLPCSPSNRIPELSLREPGNLGSGFWLDYGQSAD